MYISVFTQGKMYSVKVKCGNTLEQQNINKMTP